MDKKKRKRINLPNGCWCSEPAVIPKNWKTGGASTLDKPWSIFYRFYEPNMVDKNGKFKPYQVRIRGMNYLMHIEQRRDLARTLLNDELAALRSGYNPRLRTTIDQEEVDVELNEYTPLSVSLKLALKTKDIAEKTKVDLSNTLKHVLKAASHAKVSSIPIYEIRLKHVRAILDAAPKIKKKWSNNQFNVWKKYMGILFKELKQRGVIDHNPANEVDCRKVIRSERSEIDIDLRKRIDAHLRVEKLTRFRLFLRIFFSSGAREGELLNVQVKDVDLKNQFFWVTIYKGDSYRRVKKTITADSVRYWKLAIQNGDKGHYVFSKGLIPGPMNIRVEQLNRRWRTHIKKKLGIENDLYEMKHSRTTSVSDLYSQSHAAAANSHTSLNLVRDVYDLNNSKRKHEALKRVNVPFI